MIQSLKSVKYKIKWFYETVSVMSITFYMFTLFLYFIKCENKKLNILLWQKYLNVNFRIILSLGQINIVSFWIKCKFEAGNAFAYSYIQKSECKIFLPNKINTIILFYIVSLWF